MSKNDEKILVLKQQIEEKKKKLESNKKFIPITNCSLDFNETRININTLNISGINNLLVHLNALFLSAKDLNIENKYEVSGYILSDWITDLKVKKEFLSRQSEECSLKKMEDKLTQMLSDEKKTELELNEIADMLK